MRDDDSVEKGLWGQIECGWLRACKGEEDERGVKEIKLFGGGTSYGPLKTMKRYIFPLFLTQLYMIVGDGWGKEGWGGRWWTTRTPEKMERLLWLTAPPIVMVGGIRLLHLMQGGGVGVEYLNQGHHNNEGACYG